jgi:hypothetical protein
MLLESNDFELVWQHISACTKKDQKIGNLIESFAGRGGNWISEAQDKEIRVESRAPRGKGLRWRPKLQFRSEWEDLVRTRHFQYLLQCIVPRSVL